MATEIISACSDPAFFDYVSILEKTNEQLSFSYSFIGVGVGMLSVLVSVGAIAFAVITYKQSSEFKSSIQKFLNDQHEANTKRTENFLLEARAQNQKEIAATKVALNEANSEDKKKFEEALEALEKSKAKLENYDPSVGVTPIFNTLSGSSGIVFPTSIGSSSIYQQGILTNPSRMLYNNLDAYVVAPGTTSNMNENTSLKARVDELEAEIKKLKQS